MVHRSSDFHFLSLTRQGPGVANARIVEESVWVTMSLILLRGHNCTRMARQ